MRARGLRTDHLGIQQRPLTKRGSWRGSSSAPRSLGVVQRFPSRRLYPHGSGRLRAGRLKPASLLTILRGVGYRPGADGSRNAPGSQRLSTAPKPAYISRSRDVAQSGSAPEWGSGGRRFESGRPDWRRPRVSLPMWGFVHVAQRRPSGRPEFAGLLPPSVHRNV